MKDPQIIVMSPVWLRSLYECQVGLPNGTYAPARPLGYSSIIYRIKAAWLVITGRADALIWPGDQ